ncbi:MAG: hypothetical protein AAGI23_21130 [Bacteroidota bacterium]
MSSKDQLVEVADEETYGIATDSFEIQVLESTFEFFEVYSLADTPLADFNGDGHIDQALFMSSPNSGIIIRHGKTSEEIRLGFGVPFAHLRDFDWVDYWGIVEDEVVDEQVIDEGEVAEVQKTILNSPSIFIRRLEEGGGIITYRDGRYIWIHQAD